jgi:putative transposase
MSKSANIFNLAIGTLLRIDDHTVRLERIHDDGAIDLLDLDLEKPLAVIDEEDGRQKSPTMEWLRDMYAAGRLMVTDTKQRPQTKQAKVNELDPDLCHDRDPKATQRISLAYRIAKDKVRKTDDAYEAWLIENYGKDKRDLAFARPNASTARKWVRRLEASGMKLGSLVSRTGRARGRSQLPGAVDALTQEAALRYWTMPEMQMVDAEGWLDNQIDILNHKRPVGTQEYKKPSRQTVNNRINGLRCYETICNKFGRTYADRVYKGSGEFVEVNAPLELVMMDATQLEQVIVFDDDWALPACHLSATILLDCASHAVLGWALYAGPNRAETSAEAILSCMAPKCFNPEMMKRHPTLANIFGKPAAILPDNEKALVGPSTIPGLNEAGISVLLPPSEMPTAKAGLERCIRSLKGRLKKLPGTVLSPKLRKNLDYNGVEEACLTYAQMRRHFAQAVASHNSSPSTLLDNISPLQVWTKLQSTRATPAFTDIGYMQRTLGRHHEALLTRNGIEFDRIRYRDAELVSMLIDDMGGTAPRGGERKDGSITIKVRIRRHDGDISTIDVFNTLTNEYVTLPSTQPEYTNKLTAWEHKTFGDMAKRRKEAFVAEKARLTSAAISLAMIDEDAPHFAFQRRREMAALYQSRQIKKLAVVERPAFPSETVISPQEITPSQDDVSSLAPQSGGEPASPRQVKQKHLPPQRPDDYGAPRISEVADEIDWDSIDLTLGDPETGVEPSSRFKTLDSDGEDA